MFDVCLPLLIMSGQCLTYVYPYGATLHVVKPSVPVLSTGKITLDLVPSFLMTFWIYQIWAVSK